MKITNPESTDRVLPATINIHLTRSCNFGCRYCYAEFKETGSSRIKREQMLAILGAIAETGTTERADPRKVNFAGGEPFLHPDLCEFVAGSKNLGLKTSIVTNGSLLSDAVVSKLSGHLDILALSIDSLLPETNRRIGRYGRADPPNADQYQRIADRVRGGDIRLKINTVVNRFNLNETIGGEISSFRPFRWKIFQAKRVFGQNDVGFENLAVSAAEFNEYVTRNRRLVQTNLVIVPETADDMTGSYVMIAPNGCFFDSTLGYHRYSRPILEVGILEAFRDVEFSQDKFVKRGGLYA